MSDAVEVARIEIVQALDEDGEYVVRYNTGAAALITVLGMLAFTEHAVVADALHGDQEDS